MANQGLFNKHADFQTAVLLSESTANASPEDLQKAVKLVKAGPRQLVVGQMSSASTLFPPRLLRPPQSIVLAVFLVLGVRA